MMDREHLFNIASWKRMGNCYHDSEAEYKTKNHGVHEYQTFLGWRCKVCKQLVYARAAPDSKELGWMPYTNLNQIRELERIMSEETRIKYIDKLDIKLNDDTGNPFLLLEIFNVKHASAQDCTESMVTVGFICLEIKGE